MMQNSFSALEFTQSLIKRAIQARASDIHLEPQSDDLRIRFRIDGLLHESGDLSKAESKLVVNHLKVLAELDISETRLAQDGHFSFRLKPYYKECRVASCPSLYGEKLVLRLLEEAENLSSLTELGFNNQERQVFEQALKHPQGLILVTGPTGSGKTLSLYHALSLLNDSSRNIISIEDPVEIKLKGITQVNINRKIGFDFARALRSFLRQDPDIIMLGEIRDHETAEIVIKAAQTGHLVLSTLHTTDSISTISRLINLGVSPYNIADTLKLVIAQRLVRTFCLHCQSHGCTNCHQGYEGRTGIYEILAPNAAITTAIREYHSDHQLREIAKKQGLITLQEAGQLKVQAGITSIEELARVLPV